MKKIYAVGIALTVGLTAVAAPKAVNSKAETMAQANDSFVLSPVTNVESNGPEKAITSINDLIGLYKWSCVGHLGEEGNEKYGPRSSTVTFQENDATSIIISGFPWGGKTCKATVNVPKKTLTLTNKTYVGDNGGDPVYLYTYTFTTNSEGKMKKTRASKVTATIEDDGTIKFPDNVMIGASDDTNEANGSYYYLDTDNVFTPTTFNTPTSLDDYENVGKATFDDGWFNPVLLLSEVDPILDVEVDLLKSKTDANVFLLQNPYADAAWKEVGWMYQEATGVGYIMLNVSDPAFVQVVPLVDCGMVTDDSEAGDASELTSYYPFNEEGLAVYNGQDVDLIKEEWAEVEEPVSNVGSDNKTITLYHLYFGITGAPMGYYWWTNDKNERVATVVFPEGVIASGVNNIAVDENVETRYYNLQGFEVKNPVKGQVVIVKNGSKTHKEIVR